MDSAAFSIAYMKLYKNSRNTLHKVRKADYDSVNIKTNIKTKKKLENRNRKKNNSI